jgi:hypothetical protein
MNSSTAQLALSVRRADSFISRAAGLLFAPPLQAGEALLLAPCAAVHTLFMRYSIDVVFLDGEGRIFKIVPQLKPWRMAACRAARQTLELRAGEARRLGLTSGASLATHLSVCTQETFA